MDSPPTLPGTQLGPSRGMQRGPGEAQPHLNWGPSWYPRTSTPVHALFQLFVFGRSPPTEVKVSPGCQELGWGSGAGMFPLVGVQQEHGTGSLLAQLGAQDVWLDTGVWAAARGSPEPR